MYNFQCIHPATVVELVLLYNKHNTVKIFYNKSSFQQLIHQDFFHSPFVKYSRQINLVFGTFRSCFLQLSTHFKNCEKGKKEKLVFKKIWTSLRPESKGYKFESSLSCNLDPIQSFCFSYFHEVITIIEYR